MEYTSSDKKALIAAILQQIETSITKILDRTANISTADDFLNTPAGMEKLDAACMLLIAIGESIKNLDKITAGALLPTYPTIPWKQVMGIRDIMAHHYFDIDAEEIFHIIRHDLTPLLTAIRFFQSRH